MNKEATLNDMNTTPTSDNIIPRLIKLEQTIEAGLHTFREVGAALIEIRDDELYKPAFPSFEAYCTAKWNFSRAQAYRLIGAATIATEMSPIGDIAKETHARALGKVTKANRAAVLKKATEKAAAEGRPLTARDIEESIKAIGLPAGDVPVVDVPTNEIPTKGVSGEAPTIPDQLYALWLQATPEERDQFLLRVQTPPPAEPPVGFECNSCGAEFEDDEEALSLYECGACGTVFTPDTSANGGHQCPDCNKFASKISDCGCPECNEGELESTNPETK